MKNFPVTAKEDGKTYWVSRALAVCAIMIAYDSNKRAYLFLQKRGPECPDYQGCWSHTCGYLDYNETLKEAVNREVYEEIGLGLNKIKAKITTVNWNDNPNADPRQNVTVRYVVQVSLNDLKGSIDLNSESRGGEKSEVSDYMIVPVDTLNLDSIKFAFNHRELTEQILSDPRFFPTESDKYVSRYMSEDWEKGEIEIFGEKYDLEIICDLAGVVRINCLDLGVMFEPASLPSDILDKIVTGMVLE